MHQDAAQTVTCAAASDNRKGGELVDDGCVDATKPPQPCGVGTQGVIYSEQRPVDDVLVGALLDVQWRDGNILVGVNVMAVPERVLECVDARVFDLPLQLLHEHFGGTLALAVDSRLVTVIGRRVAANQLRRGLLDVMTR